MKDHYYAVILAGGRGERFWPLSTGKRPKQFLALTGDKTLLAEAVERLDGLIPPERILVITNKDLIGAAREACPVLPEENIIGEPVGRDTAAAVALGGALVQVRNPAAVFCVLTADHVIGDLEIFRKTLAAALSRAEAEEALITIGIQPTEPSTAYGYIEAGEAAGESGGTGFLRARRFVEKPDLETATRYCAEGRFYWNSGMFIWSAAVLERAFQKHQPVLARLMERVRTAVGGPNFKRLLKKEYESLERISVDYALMEKAGHILMARGRFAWDDVGSWTAVAAYLKRDGAGNAVRGQMEALEARDNVVVSDGRLTALVGVRNLIVVQADGVTLVCAQDHAQEVKKLVEQMKKASRFTGVL
ncbi:MAG: NTP transferase domain-containing protein [Verrucomicrobia bacterium]|nr:NTP transferase domain-containing protein [Verrucomicrobiota bacterium]MBU1908655.1 NTP transferase domain-containing protein [Verrucomicrobiota bacterium]